MTSHSQPQHVPSEAMASRDMRMTVQDPNKPQLYSAATANGIKVAACLEEIQEARACKGDTTPFDYEPHTVRIRHGESRMDFFKTINPNGKVPVLQSEGMNLWESGAILLYLAEQFDDLLPKEKTGRYECIKWLFWGSDTFSTEVKQFGFYYKYCTKKEPYPLQRAEERVKRNLEVLEWQLASHGSTFPTGEHWLCGAQYTIADLAVWPWLWALFEVYDDCVSDKFADFASYPNVKAYKERACNRIASKRALEVCVLGDA